MLTYEPKPVPPSEPASTLIASLCLGCAACVSGLLLWWPAVPGLWTLATFDPTGPIRPMGFVTGLFVFMFGGAISAVLFAMPAASLSNRRPARIIAALGATSSLLPLLNFVLFYVIVLVRGIELGD